MVRVRRGRCVWRLFLSVYVCEWVAGIALKEKEKKG